MQNFVEANIDALPGPSHHFGGLGVGNIASKQHAGRASSPMAAALQSLEKARRVAQTGAPQFLWLPPHRPKLNLLRESGFRGTDAEILKAARDEAPNLLSAAYSGAFLWAANSGTFTCGYDSQDGKYHFTPANLISSLHRFSEAGDRRADMERMFSGLPDASDTLVSNACLPPIVPLRDEGAANHMRLCDASGRVAINVFVYGNDDFVNSRFLPRQTLECCQAIARKHRLAPDNTFFVAQNPNAIAAGAFHNDVVSTSHYGLLLFHELAFADGRAALQSIEERFRTLTGNDLVLCEIKQSDLTLEQAIESYLFNSQIVGTADDMTVFCPQQCQDIPAANEQLRSIVDDPRLPIQQVEFVLLDQSMSGGGGPACVRLRVPLSSGLLEAGWGKACRLTAQRADAVERAIRDTYPAKLLLDDLASADFLLAADSALTTVRRASQSVDS